MPFRVAVGKQLSDIRFTQGTQNRVGDRVQQNVAIRVSNRPQGVFNGDSAQNEGLASAFGRRWLKAVQVISMADSRVLG